MPSGKNGVYFVVERARDNGATTQKLDAQILTEQRDFKDMLLLPELVDTYRSLPKKMKAVYAWVVATSPNVEWVVKADDDMMLHICSLRKYLAKFDSVQHHVVGNIRGGEY